MYNLSTRMAHEILIIDDKIKVCESLAQNFCALGYVSHSATGSSEAIRLYLNEKISAVILDVKLGEEDGIGVLKHLLSLNSKVPIIMITAYATIETAVESIKLGAFDYLQKPIDFNKLETVVKNAIRMKQLEEENLKFRSRLSDFSSRLVTQSGEMRELCRKARQLAATDLPILICGESGTGKELLADFIHSCSPQSCNKIVKINCSAFAESLLDNELFGHDKGAYTGADSTYQGVFERAHNSTLFLDEIGDMPLSIQAKILRTLQDKELRRVGGKAAIKMNVRFIAASNKDLQVLLAEQKFREDLFYRLNAATLSIPPVRQRREDIPLLVAHFLQDFQSGSSKKPKQLSEQVMKFFLSYDWPGNVRQLKNALHYAVAVSPKDLVDIADLPPGFLKRESSETPANIRDQMEKELILSMLQKADHNKKKAAELLNMSRKTLYNKIQKYGISMR
jgi:DNA-binding NtrC family response regulator